MSRTVTLITSEPVPDDRPSTVSHDAPDVTVQEQAGSVVMVVLTVPPAMHTLISTGATEYRQDPVSPACRTVNVRPATLSVAVRSAVS